jgi:diguanylate cyclase (GGDEF)-like protein
MLSPFNLLLITGGFCIVMLFVLCSLMRSGIAGIREWVSANGMAAVSLLLFAGRGSIPDLLSIELANTLLAAAIAMVYAGFCRFFMRRVPASALLSGLAAVLLLLLLFHYGWSSVAWRTVTVSLFHGSVCLAIAWMIFRNAQLVRSRYPYRFTTVVAVLFGCGHLFRGFIYGAQIDVLTTNTQTSIWNVVFLSIGTLVMPIFTMGAVMMVHDKMMSKAQDDANRDFLTGAWSRRAFFEFAERELLRVQRNGRAVSLMLFDVDHFKRINDTWGHAIGDRVLVEIVQRANREIRSMDYLARLGGEEFAVLLPEVGESGTRVAAERLRAALEISPPANSATPSAAAGMPYTVSIGVATRRPSESIAELLHRADIALYEAKAGGRNKVVASSSTAINEAAPQPLPAR